MENSPGSEDLIRLIQLSIEDENIRKWILSLEPLPDNLREERLFKMQLLMKNEKKGKDYINLIEKLKDKKICDAVDIPVIASGGAGSLDHLRDAFVETGCDAVLAASIFHYGTYRIKEAKDFLTKAGVSIRPFEEPGND